MTVPERMRNAVAGDEITFQSCFIERLACTPQFWGRKQAQQEYRSLYKDQNPLFEESYRLAKRGILHEKRVGNLGADLLAGTSAAETVATKVSTPSYHAS